MLNLVLDTNTLFNPQDLERLAANPQHVLWGSVVNVIETIADIRCEESFRKAKSQIALLRKVVGKNLLPDPDQLFRADIGFHLRNSGDLDMWQLMIEIVLASETYQECVKGKDNSALGIRHQLNVDQAQVWRKTYGEHFLADTTKMIQWLNPKASCTPDKWDVKLDKDGLVRLQRFFRSPEAEETLVYAILERNGIPKTLVTHDLFERAHAVLNHFSKTYQGYLLKIFRDNARPRENDYNDLHLTMAIWRPGWVLVTQESKLAEWMKLGGVSSAKYASINDLLG